MTQSICTLLPWGTVAHRQFDEGNIIETHYCMKNYQANFTKGSLMIPESRIIAKLLLDHPTADEWHEAVVKKNVLQKRTVNTAATLASLIRNRLQTMPEELWSLVASNSQETIRQALLAATVKHSPLLGDFMLIVLKDLWRNFDERLPPWSWEKYLEDLWCQDSSIPRWTETTIVTLRRTGFRILFEAGFLSDTKALNLKKVFVTPEVYSCLLDHQEDYALSCLQVCS